MAGSTRDQLMRRLAWISLKRRASRPQLARQATCHLHALFLCVIALAAAFALSVKLARAEEEGSDREVSPPITIPDRVDEARSRAMLLHEMVHGTLQVVHRDFFDEENMHAIPSSSLEDVFHEMSRSYQVDLKWLNVQTDVVNIDHEPKGEFEEHAAKELAAGKDYVERAEHGRYRFAAPIRLASQCLKCHVKRRTTTDDRIAGLLIAMPIAKRLESK